MSRTSSFRTMLGSAALLVSLAVPALHAVPWLPFGPDGGDARRIATDPQDHTHFFLGTANGWIYESRDSGQNWSRLAQVGKRDDLVLDSIAVDAKNPKHIVVGAYSLDHTDGGIFLSYDAGATWLNQAEMRGQSVRSLAVSASDSHILVAGTLEGVFRSSDGGRRWARISPADSTEIHEVESVAIDPKDPSVIYAGTWHLPWKTSDGGEHWSNIKEGIIEDSDVFSIIVDPVSPKVVYASACSGIYKSENFGELFQKVEGIPSSARRTRVLMQDPSNLDIVFAGTTEGLYRSIDAGKTWSRLTGPEVTVNDVTIDAGGLHRVLIATDRGGILASDDGGETFRPSNNGFSARQITALKRDAQHAATLYAGVVNDKDWGGVFRSDNGGIQWKQLSAGLQGRDVFSLGQAPDGTVIAGTAHGLFRLDSSNETWNRVEDAPDGLPVAPNPASPKPAVEANRRGPSAVAHSQAALHKRVKPLTVAQRKAALLKAHGRPVRRVAVNAKIKGKPAAKPHLAAAQKPSSRSAKPVAPPVDPTVAKTTRGFDGGVYSIATANRNLLATTSIGLLTSGDDGLTWVTAGPSESINWRLLAAARDDVVAASFHAVEFSADAGSTWSPVKLPEPLTQVSAVAVEPSGTIWVGSREGVFVSKDAGETWTTLKNLYVHNVNNIYYDETADRMTVTVGGASSVIFTVQLPQRTVTFAETGWNLRFARPVGDHLVAATFFDGIVVQPRVVSAAQPQAAETASSPAGILPLAAPMQR